MLIMFVLSDIVRTFACKRSIDDESALPVNLRKMREESRIVTGIHEIYGSLYDEIDFWKYSNPVG